MTDELEAMEAAAEREIDLYRAEVDRVKTDAQVKLDAHRDEINKLRALLDQATQALAGTNLHAEARSLRQLGRLDAL